MRTFLQDLRFAFRQFRKSRALFITAILSLIARNWATTAIFQRYLRRSARSLSLQDNDRMVHVQLNDKKSDRGPLFHVNASGYKDLKKVSSLDECSCSAKISEI